MTLVFPSTPPPPAPLPCSTFCFLHWCLHVEATCKDYHSRERESFAYLRRYCSRRCESRWTMEEVSCTRSRDLCFFHSFFSAICLLVSSALCHLTRRWACCSQKTTLFTHLVAIPYAIRWLFLVLFSRISYAISTCYASPVQKQKFQWIPPWNFREIICPHCNLCVTPAYQLINHRLVHNEHSDVDLRIRFLNLLFCRTFIFLELSTNVLRMSFAEVPAAQKGEP